MYKLCIQSPLFKRRILVGGTRKLNLTLKLNLPQICSKILWYYVQHVSFYCLPFSMFRPTGSSALTWSILALGRMLWSHLKQSVALKSSPGWPHVSVCFCEGRTFLRVDLKIFLRFQFTSHVLTAVTEWQELLSTVSKFNSLPHQTASF